MESLAGPMVVAFRTHRIKIVHVLVMIEAAHDLARRREMSSWGVVLPRRPSVDERQLRD
jgi:hypothetical protein